jgi:hypothetical protein
MNDEQHREDTKYVQWQDGMHVMLEDLADPLDEQEYVLAVIEDSLRDSQYFNFMGYQTKLDVCLGVRKEDVDYWADAGSAALRTKITRAQALYIATGDTDI